MFIENEGETIAKTVFGISLLKKGWYANRKKVTLIIQQFDAIFTGITVMEAVRDHPSQMLEHKDVLVQLNQCIRIAKEEMLYKKLYMVYPVGVSFFYRGFGVYVGVRSFCGFFFIRRETKE